MPERLAMARLTDKDIASINAALTEYVPIFYAGKGYERDSIVGTAEAGAVTVAISNPWSGNTGYGMKANIALTPAEARQLAFWLLAAADEQGG
jgi:hypothetical protein